MELKDQHANIGSNYSYNLITDVVNDYFTRDENKGYFKFLWTSTKDKNQEIVDLSGGPDLLNGTCKFRVKIPDKFKAGERKILKIVIGKNENNEDFVLKVHTTILDKQKSKVRERILSKKPSQKKIKDKLRDDVKTNSGGNIDDQNISSELVLPVWVNRDDWELKTSHSFNEYEVLRLKKDRDIRDLTGKAYKYRAFLNEENIFLLKERKNERANYTWNMIKQRWWVYFLWLINGGLVQHRIDKSKNRLLTIEDTESDEDKQIKPEDVDVLEIAARSVAMCVFLQQKNLLQNVSQRSSRSDQNIVNYDEESTF